jgi:hypothetical protein
LYPYNYAISLNFTTKLVDLKKYMITIINFNENYIYMIMNYKMKKKDLEQDIHKKIYNKYKLEYDTYQKNINISISKIFLKYLLHLLYLLYLLYL